MTRRTLLRSLTAHGGPCKSCGRRMPWQRYNETILFFGEALCWECLAMLHPEVGLVAHET